MSEFKIIDEHKIKLSVKLLENSTEVYFYQVFDEDLDEDDTVLIKFPKESFLNALKEGAETGKLLVSSGDGSFEILQGAGEVIYKIKYLVVSHSFETHDTSRSEARKLCRDILETIR